MEQHKHPWLESIHYTLARNGMKHVYDNVSALTKNMVKSMVRSRLCNIYEQENFASVRERESLQMLHDSDMHQHQRYLSVIKKPSIRAIFTKLWLNCSQLSTFPFQKIDYKEFIYCSNKTADIEHVLLGCRETKSLRNAYVETMNDKCCEFRLAENKKKGNYDAGT